MARDINNWVKDCQAYSRAKLTRQPVAAIQPIPVPQQCFSHFHMDLVGPLPVFKEGFRYLFTIIDRSSSWLEASLPDSMEAHFGVTERLTSDQGTQSHQHCGLTPAKPWGSSTLLPRVMG